MKLLRFEKYLTVKHVDNMITITRNITREEEIGVPELHITGSEWNRVAQVWLPVFSNWQPLDPIIATFSGEDFNTFYTEFVNDKYLVDTVLEQNNIEADTSNINDITN